MEKCNCENLECEHGESQCSNYVHPSGAYKLLYVGGCCMACYYKMPAQYRNPDGANRRKVIEKFLKES